MRLSVSKCWRDIQHGKLGVKKFIGHLIIYFVFFLKFCIQKLVKQGLMRMASILKNTLVCKQDWIKIKIPLSLIDGDFTGLGLDQGSRNRKCKSDIDKFEISQVSSNNFFDSQKNVFCVAQGYTQYRSLNGFLQK